VVSLPSLLVVYPSVRAHTLSELIALARQRPDQLTYGSAGIGTNPHLAMELFKTMAEFAAHIKDEMREWAEVARAAKIEPQ
jgi:tripartite-type tricarboxylate transporter receptor subunit TctC